VTSANWVIEIAAATGVAYGLRPVWVYHGQNDERSRGEKRVGLGLVLLVSMIPLSDVVHNVELPTSVIWLIAGLGICMGSAGYHWLTAQRTWTHGLTRRFLVGSFVVGWIVALVIPVVGDYELTHRLPTASTVRTYLMVATVIAPFIAVFLAFVLGRIG